MMSLLIRNFIKNHDNIASPLVQKSYAKLCSSVGIFLNVILFLIKLLCGFVSNSTAIIVDGFNNLADAATSLASFLGFCLAGIGAGENHPFGHGRYEWLMGFFSALAVIAMGGALAKNSIAAIRFPQKVEFNFIILFILLCSIALKLYMYFYNKKIGKKINSASMGATATDCISDMVSTSAIAISLLIGRFTDFAIDGWCGLLVSIFIIFSGLKSMLETVERLLGQAPNTEMVDKITALVMQYPQVHGINDMIIHDYGLGHFVVSMHIEGHDGESFLSLNDIANKISYDLYTKMACDATIQTDFLITNPKTLNAIETQATQIIKSIEITAHVCNLRIVNAGDDINVLLTVAGSRRLQKRESEISQAIDEALLLLGSNYRVILKLIIASLNRSR